MIQLATIAFACTLVFACAARAQDAQSGVSETGGEKILVVYFSKTGNTRAVAEHIQARVRGDLFQVAPKQPYPENYSEATEVAKRELENNARPELAETISANAMREYDVVFVGYPTWWGTLPMALFTFLEQHDFAGKTVVPFCTHGGSGLSRGPGDIAKVCSDATVGQGLAVRGGLSAGSRDDIDGWLRRLGYLQ